MYVYGMCCCSIQLQKLGIIPFDEHLSGATLSTFKMMWANNGDCISRQYTGTAAMKVNTTQKVSLYFQHINDSQITVYIGRPDTLWGEKVQWYDEGWVQLCSSVSESSNSTSVCSKEFITVSP